MILCKHGKLLCKHTMPSCGFELIVFHQACVVDIVHSVHVWLFAISFHMYSIINHI